MRQLRFFTKTPATIVFFSSKMLSRRLIFLFVSLLFSARSFPHFKEEAYTSAALSNLFVGIDPHAQQTF